LEVAVKVQRYEGKPVRDEDRDLLVVEAVEGIRHARHWWTGRQRDSLVIAVRDGEGNVTVFDAVLRRAIELDASEAAGLTTADLRAALDKVAS
jgi:hypothetical protein